jgi:hypothetical protein
MSSQASSVDDETMSNCSEISDLSVDMDDESIANEKDALTFCEFVEGLKHSKHLVDLLKFQSGLTKNKLVNMLVRTRKRSGSQRSLSSDLQSTSAKFVWLNR